MEENAQERLLAGPPSCLLRILEHAAGYPAAWSSGADDGRHCDRLWAKVALRWSDRGSTQLLGAPRLKHSYYGSAVPAPSLSILVVITDKRVQDDAHDADDDGAPECRPESLDIEAEAEDVVGEGGRDEQCDRIDDQREEPEGQ